MKNAPLILALSTLLATSALTIDARANDGLSLSLCGDPVRWNGHHDPADARIAITTEDGNVTMLLTDRAVAMQLSERMVHKVRRDLHDKKAEQDDAFGRAIVTAVIGTVSELIDNSLECRLRDVRDMSYENGRLVLIGRNGRSVFKDADLCDTDVMSSFSERDARNFVREFRRLKAAN